MSVPQNKNQAEAGSDGDGDEGQRKAFSLHALPSQPIDSIPVMDLIKSPNGQLKVKTHYQFNPSVDFEIPIEAAAASVSCTFKIRLHASGLFLDGHVEGSLPIECGRCLTVFDQPIAEDFSEQFAFAQHANKTYGKEHELTQDDFVEILNEQGNLELKDITRQHLIIAMAEHPHCPDNAC